MSKNVITLQDHELLKIKCKIKKMLKLEFGILTEKKY